MSSFCTCLFCSFCFCKKLKLLSHFHQKRGRSNTTMVVSSPPPIDKNHSPLFPFFLFSQRAVVVLVLLVFSSCTYATTQRRPTQVLPAPDSVPPFFFFPVFFVLSSLFSHTTSQPSSQSYLERLRNSAQRFGSSVSSGVSNAWRSAQERASSVRRSAQNLGNRVSTGVSNAWRATQGRVSSGVSSAWKSAQQFGRRISPRVLGPVRPAPPGSSKPFSARARDYASNLGRQISSGASKLGSKIGQWFPDRGTKNSASCKGVDCQAQGQVGWFRGRTVNGGNDKANGKASVDFGAFAQGWLCFFFCTLFSPRALYQARHPTDVPMVRATKMQVRALWLAWKQMLKAISEQAHCQPKGKYPAWLAPRLRSLQRQQRAGKIVC